MPPTVDDPLIIAGSASMSLGREVAEYLRLPLGRGEVIQFSEGNLFVRVLENVRGRQIYLIQGSVFPANDQFMELLFWIDALKRASAASVTALIPYFSWVTKRTSRACRSPPVCVPMPSRRPERIAWSRWTCTHLRFRGSFTSRSMTSTPYPSCATRSNESDCRISWSSHRTPAS
jgi:hypothetical protein